MSVTDYIDKRWELDGDSHNVVNVTDLEKKRFAYRIWRDDFERNQKREDAKESEIKDTWTEIYQLVGFDNVFQGVWFQGVTQLAPQRGCRFSVIPIILSVFVSLATIVGVYLKISKLEAIEKSLRKDRIHSSGLQSCINICGHEGVNFDFDTIEAAVDKATRVVGKNLDEASVASRIKRNILLVSLTIASILFAWGRRSGNISYTMIATTLTNSSGHDLDLKEGNAGVYRFLKTLSNSKSVVLVIDPNATYREYLVEIRDGSDKPPKLVIKSDDCIENEVLTVESLGPKEGSTSKYFLKGQTRGEASGSVPWWKRPWKRLRDLMR